MRGNRPQMKQEGFSTPSVGTSLDQAFTSSRRKGPEILMVPTSPQIAGFNNPPSQQESPIVRQIRSNLDSIYLDSQASKQLGNPSPLSPGMLGNTLQAAFPPQLSKLAGNPGMKESIDLSAQRCREFQGLGGLRNLRDSNASLEMTGVSGGCGWIYNKNQNALNPTKNNGVFATHGVPSSSIPEGPVFGKTGQVDIVPSGGKFYSDLE